MADPAPPAWQVPTQLVGLMLFAAIAFALILRPPANDDWPRR